MKIKNISNKIFDWIDEHESVFGWCRRILLWSPLVVFIGVILVSIRYTQEPNFGSIIYGATIGYQSLLSSICPNLVVESWVLAIPIWAIEVLGLVLLVCFGANKIVSRIVTDW